MIKDNNKVEKRQIALTVKEVSDVINENPNVVRNWMRELKDYIPLYKGENGYNLFNEEALDVIKKIKSLHRNQHYSINQIKTYFDNDEEIFKPVNDQEVLKDDIKEIKEELRQQKEFNKTLIEKLDLQQRYIEQRLNERDQVLLHSIKEIQEQKRLTAVTEQEHEKKSFWARIFGK
jgi:DNA-binding transcriptional MerR regulator